MHEGGRGLKLKRSQACTCAHTHTHTEHTNAHTEHTNAHTKVHTGTRTEAAIVLVCGGRSGKRAAMRSLLRLRVGKALRLAGGRGRRHPNLAERQLHLGSTVHHSHPSNCVCASAHKLLLQRRHLQAREGVSARDEDVPSFP